MAPLDALCELIDNAIDSFSAARFLGIETQNPIVIVELPSRKELSDNAGIIRVQDNGPGMSAVDAEKAIRAGFSGNNPYDSLGLFGMGFNISTGKLGVRTRFRTTRKEDSCFTETMIDLNQINNTKDYRLLAIESEKPDGFISGTIVEISMWWPEGNPNRGFIGKLVQYGLPKIREEIGRRYSTILRTRNIQIIINNDRCTPFEHCVWADNRFVERQGIGQIPAVYRFNTVIGNQKRCAKCTALIPQGDVECPSCKAVEIRTIEERIRGWVGIQRFDDQTEFGIDIIRNGRAIRISEKAAFFEFTDELKKVTKDYPIDSIYGRIVGEVELDFVPVDFLKQDFQRSSDEWQRAMLFLRGNSSLQPSQPGAAENSSCVYRLYQGYRRVRNVGKRDMYMGYWDSESGSGKRIARDIEKEYYRKFLLKEPGFYDDDEWWKKVEEADSKPLEEMIDCPVCNSQNYKEADVCAICDNILKGKTCINADCGETIALRAVSCPRCGASQIPHTSQPWRCNVCNTSNNSSSVECSNCGSAKGALNPLSLEYLSIHSNKDDELSLSGFFIELADKTNSSSLDIHVYSTNSPICSLEKQTSMPLISFKPSVREMHIFVDKTHRVYKTFHTRLEVLIASEIALFIYEINRAQSAHAEHNLTNITWSIIENAWGDQIETNSERTMNEVVAFLSQVKQRLSHVLKEESESIFDEMNEMQKKNFTDSVINSGADISRIGDMKKSGEFLLYIPDDFILKIYNGYPNEFFNGIVWDVGLGDSLGISSSLGSEAAEYASKRIITSYKNCLEDVIMLSQFHTNETLAVERCRLSLAFLQRRLVI